LPLLASKAGDDLRRDLSLRPQSAEERRLASNARPPSKEVMRHIGFGLEALHRYDAARARDELLQSVADAPGYAPSYVYLAEAWSQLGYDQKARAAAAQAAAHSAGLPEFMRLRIQEREFEAQHDWKRAIQTLRTLVTLEQGDPEVQLELIDVLLSAVDRRTRKRCSTLYSGTQPWQTTHGSSLLPDGWPTRRATPGPRKSTRNERSL